jgi:arylsulfatase
LTLVGASPDHPDGAGGPPRAARKAARILKEVMDPMEKMDPESPEWDIGRKFFASKLWAPAAASPFLTAHLKSFVDYPPRQKADSLSAKAAIDRAQKALERHN